MHNKDAAAKHLQSIERQLGSLEYFCDTEIVGDDARHLLTDIHSAQREHIRVLSEPPETVADLKPMYDRLKRINSSVKVMRNTLSQCERARNQALDSCDNLADTIAQSNPNADEDL